MTIMRVLLYESAVKDTATIVRVTFIIYYGLLQLDVVATTAGAIIFRRNLLLYDQPRQPVVLQIWKAVTDPLDRNGPTGDIHMLLRGRLTLLAHQIARNKSRLRASLHCSHSRAYRELPLDHYYILMTDQNESERYETTLRNGSLAGFQ